jgi:hypothetical protein
MSTPEGACGRGALCSQLFAALPLIENGDRRGHQPGKVTPVLAEPLAARVKADAACIPPAAKAVMTFDATKWQTGAPYGRRAKNLNETMHKQSAAVQDRRIRLLV